MAESAKVDDVGVVASFTKMSFGVDVVFGQACNFKASGALVYLTHDNLL